MEQAEPNEAGVAPAGAVRISGHLDTRTAALEVADELFDEIGPGADLVLLFGSFHHRAAFAEAAETVRQTLAPGVLLGTTAESVLGGAEEREGLAGLAVMAVRMPGARVRAWGSTPDDPIPISDPPAIPGRIGIDADARAVLLLADPFSTPITRLLPALAAAGADAPLPVVGGLASGASQPGHNVLVVDDRVLHAGAVGATVSGAVQVDCVVSQGCRPIGRPLVVTKAHGNVILELGGRRAVEVLEETAGELPDEDKRLLTGGLLVGSVIDEYKQHFGRGDFLVRNVLGLKKEVGGIAVGELGRVGQTIQFHVRDADSAAEDLQLLLDGQQLAEPPFAVLLFTCNGRGKRLFGRTDHDVTVVRERLGEPPVAGFFAAGEIGPVGDRSFLHGHTASIAVLRRP
ncbi:MAG: FIST signal transduction protein [Planctomycetota bacterium]|jgi:small ligand-binding sensory domain FIST